MDFLHQFAASLYRKRTGRRSKDRLLAGACAKSTALKSFYRFHPRSMLHLIRGGECVGWLVAANDTYFSPGLSRRLADAFRAAGGKVQFSVLPPSGSEGHWMAESETGVKLAESVLIRALKPDASNTAKKL